MDDLDLLAALGDAPVDAQDLGQDFCFESLLPHLTPPCPMLPLRPLPAKWLIIGDGSGSSKNICHASCTGWMQDEVLDGDGDVTGAPGEHDSCRDDDGESAGTEGSERMVAARDLCSEDGQSNDSSVQSDHEGDGDGDEALFPEDLEGAEPLPPPVPDPAVPPPPPPLPEWTMTPAGYTYTDPDDPRTCFGRLTAFRGQRAMRCYAHPGCSWVLPRTSTIPSDNLVRWALAGRVAADVRTKEEHMRKRPEFS